MTTKALPVTNGTYIKIKGTLKEFAGTNPDQFLLGVGFPYRVLEQIKLFVNSSKVYEEIQNVYRNPDNNEIKNIIIMIHRINSEINIYAVEKNDHLSIINLQRSLLQKLSNIRETV